MNNKKQGHTDDEIIEQIEITMKEVSYAAEGSKCLWAGIIPIAKEKRDTNRKIMDLNERIRAMCYKHRWGYVDPWEFMHIIKTTDRQTRDKDRIYWVDGLHLDEGGATVYANAVKAAVTHQGN